MLVFMSDLWYNESNGDLTVYELNRYYGGRAIMNIAFLAHDTKKELITQLCISYEQILSEHSLYATAPTANVISEDTNLQFYRFLSGYAGGDVQIAARVAYDEIDLVIFFIDHKDPASKDPGVATLLRYCDIHNVPIATNIASAEVLIHGLEHGDFGWRDIIKEQNKTDNKHAADDK